MKALFVGLGGVGQRHLRNLQAIVGDQLEVIAYRTRKLPQVITSTLDIEPGADIDEKYGITVFDDLDQALAQNPDAVFICNPTSMHIPIAMAAAEHGCPIFVEKALSHNLDGVPELIRMVEDKGIVAMVGYQLRFHPCLNALRDIVTTGGIGRILAINAEVGEYMPGWHKYEDYREMYASRKDLGGGVIVSQIHEFDYILWLLGLPKRVYAVGGHLSSLEIDVEDVASITMEAYSDGHLVPVHLHQDYIQRPPSRTCKVIGDKGKVVLDFAALNVIHYGEDGTVVDEKDFSDFDRNQLFIDEMKHFLACIKDKVDPCVTIRDGAQSLRMAMAAKESLETGAVVDLDAEAL